MNASATFRFGSCELLPARRQLLVDGQPAPLGARAIDLLHALVERRDRTVPKGELLDIVWPDVFVEEANLHVQVSGLRKVLGSDVIATVPGRGYRFVAPLDNESASVTLPQVAPTVHSKTLPAQPLSLIGREQELSELARYVSSQPLVTVTGAGGIGKTRLALAVATLLADQWKDGVAWVEAASVFDSTQLLSAVAQATRITLAGGYSADKVAVALQLHSMLLVIDNCEHLLDAAVLLVQSLRREAPTVHILLTSQAALRLQGEQVFTLQPLALPRAEDEPDERFGALHLFAERVRALDRHFVLDAANGPVVADICRQLDGLPLAIELAAARSHLLGVRGLRDRLAQRLQLLAGGSRDLPHRHQTLRAALEWSHSLLGPAEQAVLRRLGVFVGGFTLDLAQQVAADDASGSLDSWAVLDSLGTLVDRSLVSVDAGEPVRYRLLETMRVFALEQLATAGETVGLRARHARAVANLFAAVDESRWGDSGKATASEAAQRLQPEIDNARAALDWAMDAADWVLAITLAGAAAPLYVQLGLIGELLPRLNAMRVHLELAPPSAQVNLLWRLGTFGIQGGMSHEELQRVKQEAVERARAAGFRRRLQTALAAFGFTLARRGDIEETQRVIAELRSLERLDDPAYVRGLRLTVEMMLHEHRQDIPQVIASLERQRAVLQEAPDETWPLMACESNLMAYMNCVDRHQEAAALGMALLVRPDLPRTFLQVACQTAYALAALGRLDEAFDIMRSRRRELRMSPIGIYSAEALAMLCIADGRLDDAVRIDAALERHIRASGNKVHPLTREFRARLLEAVNDVGIQPGDLQRWRVEGEALSDGVAVDLALRTTSAVESYPVLDD